MKRILVDDLGRIVGTCEGPRGFGVVEYGVRDRDGILHVHGRARALAASHPDVRRAKRFATREWDI